MEIYIKITGSGKPRNVADELREIADAIENITNLKEVEVIHEKAHLCAEINEFPEE